jgi:ER degradation enhancer, mannosidase alpha-like 3
MQEMIELSKNSAVPQSELYVSVMKFNFNFLFKINLFHF